MIEITLRTQPSLRNVSPRAILTPWRGGSASKVDLLNMWLMGRLLRFEMGGGMLVAETIGRIRRGGVDQGDRA
jgi:hypothetical protein